ncbi:MAG TPA: 3-dehydroquinate synthase [Clostridia bacterium]
MIKVNIDLGERSYPIYITSGYDNLGKCIHSAKIQGKVVIITDSNVDVHQAGRCCEALLKEGCEPHKYVIEAGEKSKNLDTVRDIYKFLIGLKLDRQSTIIALGGGVTGDISGFVAATFLRGINFVQIPTTLLAQADSSVGGKVGVDFEGSKNIIGAFYQPKFVYMNVDSLRTLPERDLKSGLAEIIKHGVIKDADFLDYIDYNAKKIFSFDEDVLQYLAKANCSIKGSVVEQDEKESGLREILNFGHTIGHAIETISGFDLLHGECVALGMVAACKMAVYMELAEEEVLKKVVGVLDKTGLPVSLPGIDVDMVYNQMFLDKKVKNGKLTFVLPRKIGEVVQLGIDDEALIKRVIRELK